MRTKAEELMRWVGFIPRLLVAIFVGTVFGAVLLVFSLFMPEAISNVGDLFRDMKRFVMQPEEPPARRYTE